MYIYITDIYITIYIYRYFGIYVSRSLNYDVHIYMYTYIYHGIYVEKYVIQGIHHEIHGLEYIVNRAKYIQFGNGFNISMPNTI